MHFWGDRMDLKKLYTVHLVKLLPQGMAWSDKATANIYKLLEGMAGELAKSQMRFDKIIAEADPRTTLELLPEWEKHAGLPDECSKLGDNIQKRRENVILKLTGISGQSIADFEKLLEFLNINAKITEIRPFICGLSHLGQDRLNGNAENRHYFIVEILEKRVTWFRCGMSELGISPFATIDYAEELECFLNRFKPAHTIPIVSYN